MPKGVDVMLLHAETSPNTYSSPKLKKLTAEQAKPFLVQHANRGNQGAQNLLELLFPEPNDRAT
jgi:hypothetical protein